MSRGQNGWMSADDPRRQGPSLGDARDLGGGGRRPRFAEFRTTFIGLVMVLGGVAGAGCFLAAAGEGNAAVSVLLGVVAAAMLIIGFVLVVASSHARGGMLAGDPTPTERRNYRSMYRGPRPSAH
jgi:hypothetical protein